MLAGEELCLDRAEVIKSIRRQIDAYFLVPKCLCYYSEAVKLWLKKKKVVHRYKGKNL